MRGNELRNPYPPEEYARVLAAKATFAGFFQFTNALFINLTQARSALRHWLSLNNLGKKEVDWKSLFPSIAYGFQERVFP